MKNNVKLSPQQKRVVNLIGRGLSYPEIALEMELSLETVRYYVDLVRHKTGLRRKSLLAIWARQRSMR